MSIMTGKITISCWQYYALWATVILASANTLCRWAVDWRRRRSRVKILTSRAGVATGIKAP